MLDKTSHMDVVSSKGSVSIAPLPASVFIINA